MELANTRNDAAAAASAPQPAKAIKVGVGLHIIFETTLILCTNQESQ